MDAPPPEDIRPFLRIAAHLQAIGVLVPAAVIKADPINGLILEEDLGDDLLSPPPRRRRTAGPTPGLRHRRPRNPPNRPPTRRPAALERPPPWPLPPWAPSSTGGGPPASAPQPPNPLATTSPPALTATLEPIASGPTTLVHRDFFAGNLIRLRDQTVAVIDFQSAAIGHPAYDLVSLLQDARRDIPPASQSRALARYLKARPDLNPDQFRAAFTACAAQRHLRVACQWVRLALRDNRPQYLAYGPRTWRLLDEALSQPAAAPLQAALNRWIPQAARGNPPSLSPGLHP